MVVEVNDVKVTFDGNSMFSIQVNTVPSDSTGMLVSRATVEDNCFHKVALPANRIFTNAGTPRNTSFCSSMITCDSIFTWGEEKGKGRQDGRGDAGDIPQRKRKQAPDLLAPDAPPQCACLQDPVNSAAARAECEPVDVYSVFADANFLDVDATSALFNCLCDWCLDPALA